jgi:hypothetical protein
MGASFSSQSMESGESESKGQLIIIAATSFAATTSIL